MSRRMGLWWVVPMLVVGAMRVHAQAEGGEPLTRAPRFLIASASSARPVRADVTRVPMLRQRISVAFDGVPLRVALAAIAEKSAMKLDYSDAVVPLNRTVRLTADDITVAAALTVVLLDADVDVMLDRVGRATLVRRSSIGDEARGAPGTIAGKITDAKTGDALVGAEVLVEGTRARTTSGDKGYYRLNDVEAGNYTLVVRRVGYARQARAVTVTAMQELAVDVALQPVVTQLNEIVTTVTGEQRRIELGHVVGVINADSTVREAPISTLSELLTGRVPGLQVTQGQGTVGGAVKLQIRGKNSLALKNEPIFVIDGIRYANAVVPRALYGGGPAETEATSPLNDLNPNDIESVEVVKGPSAATLYGTDAANGVIVIRTKRGQPGPARWNAYARGSRSDVPQFNYEENYWGWGTAFGVTNKYNCNLAYVTFGYCTQRDSVTSVPNPLNNSRTTIFGNAPRYDYGLNLSGGRQDVRYYFSAGLEHAVGPIRMPEAAIAPLENRLGTELSDQLRNPNTLNNLNLRGNVTAELGAGNVTANIAYLRGAARTLATDNPYTKGLTTTDPFDPYGTRYGSRPEDIFAGQSTERTDRLVGSSTAQWRPTTWLLTRATAGVDLGSRNRGSLLPRGAATGSPTPNGTPSDFIEGVVTDDRARELATTADVNVTATVRRHRLSSRTAVGAQYVRTLLDNLQAAGRGLPPGGTSIGEAASIRTTRTYTETVTLGSYIEETIGFNERLFLTGAIRVDGASAFGADYNATVYPKFNMSWLVSHEPFFPRLPGLDELRLRYAYGTSGQQPAPNASRPSYSPRQGFVDGTVSTVLGLSGLGNPDLRPERVREHEMGADLTALDGRLQVGATWYRRKTIDQLTSIALPAGYGGIATNLGLTQQHGFELELLAHLVDTRAFAWDITAQHSLQRTKVISLGPTAVDRKTPGGGAVKGYSIGARFIASYVYADTNGNGVIDNAYPYGEIAIGPMIYAGESSPPSMQTLTAAFGFFDRRVRLSTLFERRAGFTQINSLKTQQCAYSGRCRALVDPTAPLADQAAANMAINPAAWTFVEKADFTRLREVSIAAELPGNLTRAMRVRSAVVSLSARNVALWTDFTGADPESAEMDTNSLGSGGIPQSRTWTLRFDLGF